MGTGGKRTAAAIENRAVLQGDFPDGAYGFQTFAYRVAQRQRVGSAAVGGVEHEDFGALCPIGLKSHKPLHQFCRGKAVGLQRGYVPALCLHVPVCQRPRGFHQGFPQERTARAVGGKRQSLGQLFGIEFPCAVDEDGTCGAVHHARIPAQAAQQGTELPVDSRFPQTEREENPAARKSGKRICGGNFLMGHAKERTREDLPHAQMRTGGDYDQWLHGSSNSFRRV